MSMTDLIQQLYSGEHELYDCASDKEIEQTEKAIGRPLPPSFKSFVKTFSNGAYLYTIQEVSAVGDGNEQIGSIQSNYPIDLGMNEVRFREEGTAQTEDLIPFGLDSNGNAWCFIIDPQGSNEEPSVAYLAPMMPMPQDPEPPKLYGRLKGFESWLALLIERQNEVIREIYPDDVLYNELQLG